MEWLLEDLSDDEWRSPSRCREWSIHDVVSHLVTVNSFWAGSATRRPRGLRPPACSATFGPGRTPALDHRRDAALAPKEVFDQLRRVDYSLPTRSTPADTHGWSTLAETPAGTCRFACSLSTRCGRLGARARHRTSARDPHGRGTRRVAILFALRGRGRSGVDGEHRHIVREHTGSRGKRPRRSVRARGDRRGGSNADGSGPDTCRGGCAARRWELIKRSASGGRSPPAPPSSGAPC